MTRSDILDKAKKCVCGQREQDYGSPENNFRAIAELWTAYFDMEGVIFTPVDVAMMMSLLKIARIKTGTATEDSFVDLAGYAACGGEIAADNYQNKCRYESEIPTDNTMGFEYDDILFETRVDAYLVLDQLESAIAKYGVVSVADLYDFADIACWNHITSAYGWTDIPTAKVTRGRDGYILRLPKPVRIH